MLRFENVFWEFMNSDGKIENLKICFEISGTQMTPCDKFRDLNIHFQSSGIWITHQDKFEDRPYILLFFLNNGQGYSLVNDFPFFKN